MQFNVGIRRPYHLRLSSDDEWELPFDFLGFSALLRRYLPNIETMTIRGMSVKNFELNNLPKLKFLQFIGPQHTDDKWSLKVRDHSIKIICI